MAGRTRMKEGRYREGRVRELSSRREGGKRKREYQVVRGREGEEGRVKVSVE